MTERWMCIFDAWAGAHARGVFPTKQEAMRFAERHAHAVASTGTPLKWEDTGQSSVLLTQLGDYLIASTIQDRLP